MRTREIVSTIIVGTVALELSQYAFSSSLKRKKKQERTDVTDKSILEAHHIKEARLGGPDTPENLEVVTRVEHGLIHYARMLVSRGGDRRAESWAVGKIVSRMGEEEREEFNSKLTEVSKRR